MANVVHKRVVAAFNVDSYNTTAVCAQTIDNGCVFKLEQYSTNEGESMVWQAEQATATDLGLWMATSPEVVITRAWEGDAVAPPLDVKNVVRDPRAFRNLAGRVIDCTLLQKGDLIEMTAEGIAGADTNDYLVPAAADFMLESAATAGTGLCLQKVDTKWLPIGNAALVKTRVPFYKYKVISN